MRIFRAYVLRFAYTRYLSKFKALRTNVFTIHVIIFINTKFYCFDFLLFLSDQKEKFLQELARENTQLLFNAIWKVIFHVYLPTFSFYGIDMNCSYLCMFRDNEVISKFIPLISSYFGRKAMQTNGKSQFQFKSCEISLTEPLFPAIW